MTEDQIILLITTTQPAPSLTDVVSMISDFDADYTKLSQAMVTLKIIKEPKPFMAALRQERRRQHVIAMLGTVPGNTHELVEAILDTCGFKIDASSPTPLSWIDPVRKHRSLFSDRTLLQVALDKNRNLLSSQFKDSDIRNEVEFFQTNTQEVLRSEVVKKITTPAPFDWSLTVKTCFDLTEVGEEITIAVLKKFIWQVKRKMLGVAVTHHLMPVFYGSQGCGKTIFVSKMLEVLGSLWEITDFSRLTDNREATLFDNYALFLDEMHKADRAEMDGVKGVITKAQHSYRPMGTNSTAKAPMNSTFIGCSNRLLQQLINDPTGNRRFFQIDFNSQSAEPEWAFVNSLDFAAMWGSVDHLAEDPSKHLHNEMSAIRKLSQNSTSVGLFLKQLADNGGLYPSKEFGGVITRSIGKETLRKEELFHSYRSYCDAMRVAKPYEQESFYTELRRMMRTGEADSVATRKTKAFNGWAFTGDLKTAEEFERDRFRANASAKFVKARVKHEARLSPAEFHS